MVRSVSRASSSRLSIDTSSVILVSTRSISLSNGCLPGLRAPSAAGHLTGTACGTGTRGSRSTGSCRLGRVRLLIACFVATGSMNRICDGIRVSCGLHALHDCLWQTFGCLLSNDLRKLSTSLEALLPHDAVLALPYLLSLQCNYVVDRQVAKANALVV